MVVLAVLWSATLAKTDDAWLEELKDDILKTKLRLEKEIYFNLKVR